MADNYSAWKIDAKDFPKDGSMEQKIQFLIGYGILAPSTHNTQPWKFEINDDKLQITADPKLMLTEGDPTGRNLQISLGCCVVNIIEAARVFGLKVDCEWSPHMISLKFTTGYTKPSSGRLLKAITDRYSDKLLYKPVPLKNTHKNSLMKVSTPAGCGLTLVTDKQQIKIISGIHRSAILDYSDNRGFFAELSTWLRPSNTKLEDGMPGFVIGLSSAQSKAMRVVVRRFRPIAKVLAKKDVQAISSSSAVGLITTKNDSPKEWFNAGIYYENLALEATSCGLVMTPLAAIIDRSKQRTIIKNELDLPGPAQMFFRVGYSNHKPYHTPRRNNIYGNSMKTQQQLLKIIDTKLETKQAVIGPYKIKYVVAGEGTPLLLLHGANIGWAQWYQNIGDLSKHFKVYALDLPGAGSSTPVDFHKTDFEKDYLRIVDEFITQNKFKKLHIVGSSFGGWIALRLAMEKQPYIDKIVLANPLGFTTHMPLQFRPVSFKPFAKLLSKTALKPDRNNKNLEKFMRDVFFDKQLKLAPQFIDYFYELSKTSHNIMFISRLAHFKGMRKELFLGESLSEIDVPVMVIWGEEDPLMPFSTVKDNIALIPNVKLETLKNIGHMPPVEAAPKFNELAINFLSKNNK